MNPPDINKLRRVRRLNGIVQGMMVCGNCDHYIWDEGYNRHRGDCSKKHNEHCPAYTYIIIGTGLHALTQVGNIFCPYIEVDI